MNSGEALGQWRLVDRLGRGGNGEVWRCVSPDGEQAAVKILIHQHGERLGRFRNEVDFLLGPGRRLGVVPILDHELSGRGKVWYAMPLAVPIRTALGSAAEPHEIVQAMATISATLAGLAKEKISHRDIKPDNLLRLDGVWSIGDFGLVKYPASRPLTRHGRKLGPTDFMAPEMRESPDTADAELADTYSVAKTLWVLLAGLNLPFPGQHRADDEICRLTARLDYRWAPQLDLLIERCTFNDPGKRPRMREIAIELAAMVQPGTKVIDMEDTSGLERRIAEMTERHRRRDEDRNLFNNSVARAWHRLTEEVAQPAYWELARCLPNFSTRHPVDVAMPRALLTLPSAYIGAETWGGMLLAPGDLDVRIELGVSLRVNDEAGRATIGAVVNVHRFNGGRGMGVSILEHMSEAIVGSARFDVTLGDCRAAFAACLAEALVKVTEAIEAEAARR
jgi:hypothetical protein